MIKQFFVTAGRNLLSNKVFSFLNIAGLAIGIACAGLIFLWKEYYANFNDSIPEAAVMCLLIAFLTVSTQALKAGRRNPFKSLSSD